MSRIVAGQTKTIGISLASVANAGKFQVAPTLDAADFRISINGGAFAALTNTPTVTPASGARVQVIFAAAETTAAGAGGEIFLKCSDSSGAEWHDLSIPFPVFANAEDTNITLADNAITAAKIATDAIDTDALATDAVAEIVAAMTAPDNAGIDEIKTKTDNLPVDTASVLTAIAAYIDTEIAAIKAKTDNLPASPAATGDIPTPPTAIAIADAVLGRSVSNIDDTASTHSLYELIQAILEGNTSTGAWVVYKTNGSTVFNTRTLATDPDAEPIVGVS